MIEMTKTLLCAAAFGLATGAASAQDSSAQDSTAMQTTGQDGSAGQDPAQGEEGGQLVLTIGDAEYTYALWESQSDWSGSENFASINIYSRPGDDATSAVFGPLTLSFDYMGGTVNNPEFTLSRETETSEGEKLFGNGEPGSVVVTVDTISADRDLLTLSGNISGAIGTSEDNGRTVDMSAPLSVSGQFEVSLGPVE